MQVCLKYICAAALLFSGVALMGSSMRRPMFTSVKVGFRLLPAPRVKAGSVSSVSRGSLSLQNHRWGVVEIAFVPRYDFEKSGNKSKNTLSGVWIDEVACGVRLVALDGTRKNLEPLALFSTKVDFWTIPADGREHRYFVYLPPVLLDRVMPVRRSESRNIKIAEPANFAASVVFFNKKWGVLGEGYYGIKNRPEDKAFARLAQAVPAQNVFHGALMSRARSPWGVNDVDQFDLEKPAFIPAPLDDAAITRAADEAAIEEKKSASDKESSSKSEKVKKNRKSKR